MRAVGIEGNPAVRLGGVDGRRTASQFADCIHTAALELARCLINRILIAVIAAQLVDRTFRAFLVQELHIRLQLHKRQAGVDRVDSPHNALGIRSTAVRSVGEQQPALRPPRGSEYAGQTAPLGFQIDGRKKPQIANETQATKGLDPPPLAGRRYDYHLQALIGATGRRFTGRAERIITGGLGSHRQWGQGLVAVRDFGLVAGQRVETIVAGQLGDDQRRGEPHSARVIREDRATVVAIIRTGRQDCGRGLRLANRLSGTAATVHRKH